MRHSTSKKRLLSTLTIGLALLTSCGTEEPKMDVQDLLQNVEPIEEVKAVDELPNEFLQANANFSLELFKHLAEEENTVYSPVPVYYSLALLANGTDEEAQSEILARLAVEEMDLEDMNRYYHELIRRFEQDNPGVELNLSNSIWVDEGFKPNEDFLKTNKTYYGTDSYKVDFGNRETPELMNDWVSEATNGKIDEMIEELSANAVMYLFSTIYFNADWEIPFDAADTYESDFLVGEEKIKVEKMTGRFEIETVKTADEEGIILPYKDDRYSFIALLPNESMDIRDYLTRLDDAKLVELIYEIKEEEVDLMLPKFEVRFENTLINPLEEMGIQRIFDPKTNSLSSLGTADGNLYVSNMFQKTYLVLDEEGTEAASAVGTEISETSLLMETRMIDFNRPFLYGVVENETGLPVFMGIMDRPIE